eukprot:2378802-Rhodomonas_salina.1
MAAKHVQPRVCTMYQEADTSSTAEMGWVCTTVPASQCTGAQAGRFTTGQLHPQLHCHSAGSQTPCSPPLLKLP